MNDSFNEYDPDFIYFDENPEEDPFTDVDEADHVRELEAAIKTAIEDYLAIRNPSELLHLVADCILDFENNYL